MLKAIILLLLTILQVRLLYTGDILYYLAPGMIPFLYFSSICFGLLAAYKALSIIAGADIDRNVSCNCDCQGGHPPPFRNQVMYALFLLPLGLGFFMPPKLLDSSMVEKKGIVYHQIAQPESPRTQKKDIYSQPGEIDHQWWAEYEFSPSGQETLPPEQQTLKQELGFWYDGDYYPELADRLLSMDRIVVEDMVFLDTMLTIAAYQDRFQDREIEISGFVYRDRAMSGNELAVTRTAITCCLADATFYGILVRGDGLDDFENDSWVRIRGVINQDFIFDQNMLMITALETESIPPPDSPYVYPYLFRKYMP